MGKFSSMLDKTKSKINNAHPERQWDHTPILEFKFRRFHFSHVEQNEQASSVQTQQIPNHEQIQSPNSPVDQDCLVIEPEHNSFDQSDDESDTSDLTESIARVNSLNLLLEERFAWN